jgi:hypothetical protein
MKTQLQLNGSKTSDKHPLLIGSIDVEGTRRIAIWHHEDRGSEYYSGKLTQGERDPSPISLKALGAFAKSTSSDPDFATREPVQIGDSLYNAYMWLRLDEDDDLCFDFEVTTKTYTQKLSDEVAKFKANLKKKLLATKPVPVAVNEYGEPSDIAF